MEKTTDVQAELASLTCGLGVFAALLARMSVPPDARALPGKPIGSPFYFAKLVAPGTFGKKHQIITSERPPEAFLVRTERSLENGKPLTWANAFEHDAITECLLQSGAFCQKGFARYLLWLIVTGAETMPAGSQGILLRGRS